jgi:hypothetical protein
MANKNLFEIMQNNAISTIALHSFILGYSKVAKKKRQRSTNPKLEYLFFVLPIVYNQSSMETFRSSNQLYTALLSNKAIILGLQERAVKMKRQTFDSLNLAFNKGILNYNKEQKKIEVGKQFRAKKLSLFLSQNNTGNNIKKIQDCAFKLGGVFAKKNEKNLQLELNIRF